jgi:CoA:oxalate CoA-transferase
MTKGPLNGIRVIDFTWKAVGPWSSRMLTPYGAEVIHVEPPHEPDDHRWDARRGQGITMTDHQVAHTEPGAVPSIPYYTAPYYSQIHNGRKRLLEELVKISDGLTENFSARVLDNWGLGWERLHELNPRLVYLSTSGFGHAGELSGYRTYGPRRRAA